MFSIKDTPVYREKKSFNEYIEGVFLHFLLNNPMECDFGSNPLRSTKGDDT